MKVKKNGTMTEMSYEDICKDLGFIADVHFVKVTNRGTISYTVGKPEEIRELRAAVQSAGYVPAKALLGE